MEISEYKDMFLAESQEYLQSLNDSLLKLEKEPNNLELVQEMFRAAHSLKGMSATMSYNDIAGLTHEMENVLDRLREGEINLSREFADVLFQSLDTLESLLARVENPQLPEVDIVSRVEALKGLVSTPYNRETAVSREKTISKEEVQADDAVLQLDEFEKEIIKEVEGTGEKIYYIEVTLVSNCLLKSVRAYMVIKALENNGVVLKARPPVSDLEEENFESSFQLLCQTDESIDSVQKTLTSIAEIEKVTVKEYEEVGMREVGSGDLEDGSGEKTNNSEKQIRGSRKDSEVNLEKKASEKPVQKGNIPTVAAKPQTAKSQPMKSAEKTIRVETEKLDKLINLVGELVVNRTRLLETAKQVEALEIAGAVEHLDRITADLQSAVMKLRMVPVKQVFDRFPRMVRDLSREKGKKINLEIVGEETELDKSIVNQIGEPLVHLLRNAIDHGIESTEARIKAGKSAEGTVRLEARHEGSYVAIEVKDDGAGIDKGKILKSALTKGVISQEEVGLFNEDDAVRLIFKSGFSTAERVTGISGRGVGMDAVKNIVESLSGIVDVRSKVGEGSRFIIHLPLTLAIIKAMLVKSYGEIYAIPIETIRENLYINSKEVKTVQNQEVISLRQEVLPLISLQERLTGQSAARQEEIPVVVVAVGDKKLGLIVDELLGQQEIVIKSLSKVLGDLKGIAGATVLGSGKVALILNISTLI